MNIKKRSYKCRNCGKIFEDYKTNGKRKFCSLKCKGKHNPSGKEHPRYNSIKIECRYCHKKFYKWPSQKNKSYCSKKCFANDLKGIYPKNLKGKRGTKPRTYHLRKRNKYGNAFDREWRVSVFERDNYTCQRCGNRGGRLQAHHKKPYKEFPELRHDLNNGETLCVDCHKNTKSYGWSKYWHKKSQLNASKKNEVN